MDQQGARDWLPRMILDYMLYDCMEDRKRNVTVKVWEWLIDNLKMFPNLLEFRVQSPGGTVTDDLSADEQR